MVGWWLWAWSLGAGAQNGAAPASAGASAPPKENTYVLGDSIAWGLSLDGFEAKLKARTGGEVRINFDGARSITTPGNQIKQSALDAVEKDQGAIAQSQVIVLILGMNQMEGNFAQAQQQLMARLKAIAPRARYFWVDIGATIAPQVPGWNERNRAIYKNAPVLGYEVVSRYKAIFGPDADPLNITPGKNFADWPTEPGYGGPGNVHGMYAELGAALLQAIAPPAAPSAACRARLAQSSYVLGDSISYGLVLDGLEARLEQQLGGKARISYDVGRSITHPGTNIAKTGMESLELDRAFIARAGVVVVVLGTNQSEPDFDQAQRAFVARLREINPRAQLYWVDIGATIATQAAGWNARNRTIYANAKELGYSVISRYKAIFGADADPLNIPPGRNFPGWISEDGFEGAPGNVHGMGDVLSKAVLQALPKPFANLAPGACPP
ncbi:MAG: SGNH/GDSL hydrolase family protein [Rhodoferax sp.]